MVFCPNQSEEVFYVKGALDQVLGLCRNFYSSGLVLPLTQKQEQLFHLHAARMGTAGLRGKLVAVGVEIHSVCLLYVHVYVLQNLNTKLLIAFFNLIIVGQFFRC